MTIREIANLANTSRGTVDRVLNHRGNVAVDVRQRIEKVISETGYVAKSHLKKDGKKSTYEVAVVFAKKNDSSYDGVLHGRELALAGEYRYSGIVLKNYPISIFNEREIRKALDSLSKKTKLLIISVIENKKIRDKINKLNIPVIFESIDHSSPHKVGYVGCDYFNSGALAADVANLRLKPKDRIQIRIGSLTHQGHLQRMEGFKQNIDPSFEVLTPLSTQDDEKMGYHRVKDSLAKDKPSLFVCFGSGRKGILKAIVQEKNYRPKVIAVDESNEVLEGLHNGLVSATISQYPLMQGRKCIEIAYRYLTGLESKPVRGEVTNAVVLKNTYLTSSSDKKDGKTSKK